MRKLTLAAVALGLAVAGVGATLAFAGGDPEPTCGATGCTSYRVDWHLGPPEEQQYDPHEIVGTAQITGIVGENENGSMDVYAYNSGISQTGTFGGGGGGGAGRSDFQDFTFVKAVDRASPQLAAACAAGEHFLEAHVVIETSKGTMKYDFNDVLCSLDKHGASGAPSSFPLEQFSFNYRRISWTYTPKRGTPVTECFEVQPNRSC